MDGRMQHVLHSHGFRFPKSRGPDGITGAPPVRRSRAGRAHEYPALFAGKNRIPRRLGVERNRRKRSERFVGNQSAGVVERKCQRTPPDPLQKNLISVRCLFRVATVCRSDGGTSAFALGRGSSIDVGQRANSNASRMLTMCGARFRLRTSRLTFFPR